MSDEQKPTTGNITTGNITTGNISGQNINIAGNQNFYNGVTNTMGNLTTQVTGSANVTEDTKAALIGLVKEMQDVLLTAPQEQHDAAQTLTKRTKELVEEIDVPQIEVEAVQAKANLLKKAAENINEAMPMVLTIATKIIEHAFRLSGIGV